MQDLHAFQLIKPNECFASLEVAMQVNLRRLTMHPYTRQVSSSQDKVDKHEEASAS